MRRVAGWLSSDDPASKPEFIGGGVSLPLRANAERGSNHRPIFSCATSQHRLYGLVCSFLGAVNVDLADGTL